MAAHGREAGWKSRGRALRIAGLLVASLSCLACSRQAPSLKKSGLTPEDRKAWYARLHWPEDCEKAHTSTSPDAAAVQFHHLESRRYLVEVGCAAGAYQGSQVYLYLDESHEPPSASLLHFPIYAVEEGETAPRRKLLSELWGNVEFRPKDGELIVFSRFRGPGDCGWLATYRVSGGSIELKAFRLKQQCDGQGAADPGTWSLVPLEP